MTLKERLIKFTIPLSKTYGKDLVLTNYKEPLKSVENGHGYYGAIAVTRDGSGVQCHICGNVFVNLALHIIGAHKTKVSEYKEKYQLARRSSLLSENERQKKKIRVMKWFASLSAEQKKNHIARMRSRHTSIKGMKHRLENKNKYGYCPDQLIEKIQTVTKELGHVPSLREFQKEMNKQRTGRAVFCIYQTFGSWNNALIKAGYQINEKQCTYKWTDKELLDCLIDYHKKYNKIPTKSDAKEGKIPNLMAYRSHFGGLPRARELAGLK